MRARPSSFLVHQEASVADASPRHLTEHRILTKHLHPKIIMKSALIFLAAWHLAISDAARRSSRAATVASGLFPKPEVAAVTGVPAFAQLVLASQQRVQGEEEKEAEECHMWLSHPLSSFSAGDIEKELKVKEVTEAEHIPYQGISKGNALAPDTPVTPETFQARFLKPPLDTGEENKISSLDFIKFLLLDVAADGDILANAWVGTFFSVLSLPARLRIFFCAILMCAWFVCLSGFFKQSKAKKIFVAGKWLVFWVLGVARGCFVRVARFYFHAETAAKGMIRWLRPWKKNKK